MYLSDKKRYTIYLIIPNSVLLEFVLFHWCSISNFYSLPPGKAVSLRVGSASSPPAQCSSNKFLSLLSMLQGA